MEAINAANAVLWQPGEQIENNRQTRLTDKCSSKYVSGKILHSLPAELQLRRYSEQAGAINL